MIATSFHFLRLTCHEMRVLMSVKPQVAPSATVCMSVCLRHSAGAYSLRLANEAFRAARQVKQSPTSDTDGAQVPNEFSSTTLAGQFSFYFCVTPASAKLPWQP